jgi:signal transduction histidine kinase
MADGQYNILIVDDVDGTRDTLSIRLKRDGYHVTAAENGRQALDMINAQKFDLLLLDIKLPDLSGFDVLNLIRQSRSMLELPIIMLSGDHETGEVVRALKNGANDYLTKPIDFSVMLARIKAQLTLKHFKELSDKLLNIASHDLKKPLLVIVEAARELQTEYPLGTPMDAKAEESLSMLIKSAEYMQRVVQDSLDLRAIESGHIKLARIPTDINELTKQTLERNSDYAKRKNISLSSKLDPRLPTIKADNFRLAQVLDNLLGNAIKFSPAGASTVVRTHAEDGFILLEVSDSGPGIPEEDMDKLFVEYAQLHNRATSNEKSTGLGLAICKELISLHGGEIGARNNPEGGSTFWFRLHVTS